MTRESFLQILEDHFISLNKLVHKSLLDLLGIHQEPLEKYTAHRKDLQHQKESDQESENAIRRTLAFHKANQEICNSLYTGITDSSPLTGMLSEMKQEDAGMLEMIPFKIPLEYPPGYYQWSRNNTFFFNVRRRTEWFLLTPRQALGSFLNPFRKLVGKQVPEPVIPMHQVRAKHLYRRFLLPLYLHRVSELILETRQEFTRSMSVFWEDEIKPLPEFHWQEG
jgi:hypothetical protein